MASNYSLTGRVPISNRLVAYQQPLDRCCEKEASAKSSNNWRTERYQNLGLHQDDENYGRPISGSKTDFRGQQAGVHISSEIIELCNIITIIGNPQKDGSFVVAFGVLFEYYTRISNKVVGMLLRARRQGLVEFTGEMLFQRRDDAVLIRLLKSPDQLLEDVERRKNELRSHPAGRTAK